MPTPRTLLAALAAAALLAACGGDAPAGDIPFVADDDPAEEPAVEPTSGANGEDAAPAPADEAEEEDVEPAGDGPVEVEARVIATNLEAPWEVVFADDRVFLTERDSGDVLELAEDGSTEVVLSLDIDPAGEGGLLGLIADPDADELGFYAFLTTAEDNRIVRVTPGGEPEPILTGIPKARIHNGGRIAFGPDGMLYAATGDAGEPGLAQDPDSLAGKILRVTADGDVPEDNPDADSPVYALGIRNPQGLTWTADGTLYSSSFGPERDDEVNRIEPGANYGWPEVTGEAGVEGFTDPIFVRQPPEASWSGLTALVDGAIPQWEGDLFVAALRGERLWRLVLAEDGTVAESEELFVGELGRLRQAVQAPDGSLWILTSNLDGRGSPVDDDDRIVRVGPVGS